MKQINFFILFCFGLSLSFAQQESAFNHYMFNHQSINPGYAGARGLSSFTSVVRSQWTGIEGAPLTQTLSFNAPITSKNLGFGLSVLNDKIGPTSSTSFDIDLSYHLRLNRNDHRLSIGLKLGALNYFLNPDLINTLIGNDASFESSVDKKIMANIGFGAYYYTQKFYLGLAIPRILENKDFGLERHTYLMTGGLFQMNESLLLKPSFLLKQTKTVAAFDASLLLIINERFWTGLQIRNVINRKDFFNFAESGSSALIGIQLGENLSIGYSYGFPASITNKGLNASSHELMIRFDLFQKVKGYLRSPRFF